MGVAPLADQDRQHRGAELRDYGLLKQFLCIAGRYELGLKAFVLGYRNQAQLYGRFLLGASIHIRCSSELLLWIFLSQE